MRARKLMFIFMALLFFGAAVPVLAKVIVSEDFESGTIGQSLYDPNGWDDLWEPYQTEVLNVLYADASVMDAALSGQACEYTAPAQIRTDYSTINTITPYDEDVYLRATFIVSTDSLAFAPILSELDSYYLTPTLTPGPTIGVDPNTTNPGTYNWTIRAAGWESEENMPMNGDICTMETSYEVLLQMDINQADVTLSTGTLYRRLAGASTWVADSVLQDVVLGLSVSDGTLFGTNRPSKWEGWYLRGGYYGGFDDLKMGVGDIHLCDDGLPVGDLNYDCQVNLGDFSIVAGGWLDSTE